MLNVDVKRSTDYPNHSDVDHSGDEGKKDLVLPAIKGANGGKLNMSDGNINMDEMEDYVPKPKMYFILNCRVKIVKRNKNEK
jgi:hypothetical protein